MKLNTSEIPDIVLDDLKRTIEEAIFPNRVFLFATEEKLSINYKDEHSQEEMDRLDKTRTRGIGTGDRILRTTERPAHMAKNRLSLPEEMPLDFRVYAEQLGLAV